jgi:choline dehydrogenase-like flavoprotein
VQTEGKARMSKHGDIADVLIVGAGTAGGIAAKELAEAGLDVVCLEQGQWVNQGDLPGSKPEFELLGAKQWHPDPNVRGRPEDYPCNVEDSDVPMWMYSAVGGTSVIYGGVWSRFLPSDFRTRTLDGVADDWPISYEELLPFYEETDLEVGASGMPGNPAYPPGAAPPMPAHPILKTGRRMAEAMNGLGWHWWPGYTAIPSQEYGEQKQCVRYGICRMGCPEGAKGSTDVTHWPAAMRHGARVVTGARVSRIVVDEQGRASGALYFDRDGIEHFQGATTVILAASGIGTPRLLLMSASSSHPDGLANSSGLVGKRLMTHPYAAVVGLYEDEMEDWVGPAGEELESMQFYETDSSRGFVRGCKWSLLATGGPLGMVQRLAHSEGLREEPLWGEPFTRRMKESLGHMIEWHLIPEDLPEESNCVTLDPELKDSDGLPAPKITYKISENTRKMIDFNIARALEAHEAAGAKRTWISGRGNTSGHLMGTARMGDDPATSVVGRYGEAHDVPGLFIVDGSVFVTSSGVNPTATICALAKRTAQHIVRVAAVAA